MPTSFYHCCPTKSNSLILFQLRQGLPVSAGQFLASPMAVFCPKGLAEASTMTCARNQLKKLHESTFDADSLPKGKTLKILDLLRSSRQKSSSARHRWPMPTSLYHLSHITKRTNKGTILPEILPEALSVGSNCYHEDLPTLDSFKEKFDMVKLSASEPLLHSVFKLQARQSDPPKGDFPERSESHTTKWRKILWSW